MCAIDIPAILAMARQPEYLPILFVGGVVAGFLVYSLWRGMLGQEDEQAKHKS